MRIQKPAGLPGRPYRRAGAIPLRRAYVETDPHSRDMLKVAKHGQVGEKEAREQVQGSRGGGTCDIAAGLGQQVQLEEGDDA